jgi:hypothetical protein
VYAISSIRTGVTVSSTIAAVVDLVLVEVVKAAEQAALGVVVLVARAPAQVEADGVQLAEVSMATDFRRSDVTRQADAH